MPIERSKEKDYKPLQSALGSTEPKSGDTPSLRPPRAQDSEPESLVNLGLIDGEDKTPEVAQAAPQPASEQPAKREKKASNAAPGTKEAKREKKVEKDKRLLADDRWLVRNGHGLTFFLLYLFSIMVLFRPYELVPGLGFLSATAFYFAIATLAIYIPSQLAIEGNLTMFSTEVKAVLAMTLIALATIPIAKDPGLAWETFNDPFIKAVIIFIVLVNVVRTRKRLMALLWLSFGIGVYLSFSALDSYRRGDFTVEEYRVGVDVGGMFGNPNEMALHLVMMTPLALALGMASRSKLWRWIYFAMAAMFVGANMVTFSRGGFLGLIACMMVMAWKVGRKHRLNVAIASTLIGGAAIIFAPGNYGLRMLSIFIPGLDAVGSADQRRALLERSLLVTARNPWGIGIGNFQIVGVRNLGTHNAFTQVSSELGILGLIAYLVFILSPFRKLSAIERKHFDADNLHWFYYLSIGLQASIVGYLMSSFFASVAYNWFIYYLIAYAVAFRRIHSLETEAEPQESPVIAQPTLQEA